MVQPFAPSLSQCRVLRGVLAFALMSCLTARADAAQVLRLGPIDVIPGLSMGEGYNDNVFLINLDQQGSWFTQIRPSLKIGREWNRLALDLSYNLTDTRYVSLSQNNTTNHQISTASQWVFSHRNRLNLSSSLFFGFFPLGTGLTQGIIPTANSRPVQYTSQDNQATYQFGANGAKGNLICKADYNTIKYDNQTTDTIHPIVTRYSNQDRYAINLGASFLYKVMPKTYVLFEVDENIIRYTNQLSTINNNYSRTSYLFGATWKAAGKTTGTIKLGLYDLQPDNKQIKSSLGFTGNVEVAWRPWTYSGFTLGASQATYPNIGVNTGAYINQNTYSLGWLHQWSHRLSSQLQFNAYTQNYVGTAPERQTTFFGVAAGLNYQMQPWLGFGLNYSFNKRDSTIKNYIYDQNLIILNVNMTL